MSKCTKNKLYEACWVIIFCCAAITIFFYPALLQGKLIYQIDYGGTDTLDLHIARRCLAVQCIRQYGEFPLWEPKIASGVPLFAESEAGILHPTFLFFFLHNLTLAANLTVFSAILIAMLGSYSWSRCLGLDPLPSGLAAVSYGLGEAFLLRTGAFNILHVIACLPWSLAALHQIAQRAQKRYWFALVLIWTWQLLSSHFQMFAVCQICCWLYIGVLLFTVSSCSGIARYKMLLPASALLCTLALGAVQVLPTQEFTLQSVRNRVMPIEQLVIFSPNWRDIAIFINPFYYNNYNEIKILPGYEMIFKARDGFNYIGLLPILLVISTLFAAKKRQTAGLWIMAAFFGLAALGPRFGLYYLLWKYVPFINAFRLPGRFVVPLVCILAVLASFGAQRLKDWLASKGSKRTARTVLTLVIIMTLGDLGYVNARIQHYVSPDWQNPPGTLQFIHKNNSVFTLNSRNHWVNTLKSAEPDYHSLIDMHRGLLCTNLASVWGTSSWDDYVCQNGGITLYNSAALQIAVSHLMYDVLPNFTYHDKQMLTEKICGWLRLLGVGCIVTDAPLEDYWPKALLNRCEHIAAGGDAAADIYIYTFDKPLDRIRLVPVLNDRMPMGSLNLWKSLSIIERESLYEEDLADPKSIGAVAVESAANNRIKLHTECEQNAFLVINNTYDQQWQAWVDGEPTAIRCTNMAMQSLPIPAGRHSVELKYISPAFDLGWRISAAFLAVILAAAAASAVSAYRQRRQSDSAADTVPGE